jgi:hypothetical protein
MKETRQETEQPEPPHTDHRIPGGCATCGGDLQVRVSASGARAYCGRCAALTSPVMVTTRDGWHLHHRAAAA